MWQRISSKPVVWIFGLYVMCFALFFWGIHQGLGNYWDWSFPYFSDQLSTLFSNKASSWITANAGSPLGYSSDYFLRFAVSLCGFLPPELVRYGVFVATFAAGALGMYRLARHHTSAGLSFLLGLITFINPAIFYKYTAGHVNYLIAFVVFIYLVYFLLHRFDKTLRSAVITGLFVAALGIQIQFFVIGGIFLILFFACNRQRFSWKYLAVIGLVPLLIHLVWIINFITGAMSASETSSAAAQGSVKHSASSDFLSIFTFSFSKATLLSKFYAFYELLWNASLFVFLLWLLVRQKKQGTATIMLLVFLAIMIFMATGLYQVVRLGPLAGLYPMLREVGHFAPVIVLVALLVIARLVQQSRWRWILVCVLIGSLTIVGVKFQYYSQAYRFADVRSKLAPFKTFANKDTSDYRILSYPFFGKYSFNHLPKDPQTMFPLSNVGHDSFATFSKESFINNAVAPHEFKNSVQYKLLQTYDVDVLRPYNIKYLFDFSKIYESNYDRYVPATVYDNDLSLIKTDKQFFAKLLARNPGKLRQVSEHIYELTNVQPHVATTTDVFTIPYETDAAAARSFTRRALGKPLDYVLEKDNLGAYSTKLTPLFNDPTKTSINPTTGAFVQKDMPGQSLYINTAYAAVSYEVSQGQLTVFANVAGTLTAGEQQFPAGREGRRTILQLPVGNERYYISFRGKITPLAHGPMQSLGTGQEGDTLTVFKAETHNLVANSSFEQGLWQQTVGDCNQYDDDAELAMERTTKTAKGGSASLELRATKHDACTSTAVSLAANTQYLVSYDYQSPNAQTANMFLSYGGDREHFAKDFRAITDDRWHSATKLITTPDKTDQARLFLYALEQDGGQATTNRYDNVSIVKLSTVQESTIPTQANPYKEVALSTNNHTFTYSGSDQQFQNLIANPSFERGSWQRTVSDCNNYDKVPELGMRITEDQASHGRQSLELRATRHDACVRTTANITEDTDYLLSFDYQTEGSTSVGYATSFDDPKTTVARQQLAADNGTGWHRAAVKIRAPDRASALTLYLYAFEASGKQGIVRYDNVSLMALPDFSDRFYLVKPPNEPLQTPKAMHATGSNPTQKNIHVTGATTPFFVALSETYHPQWRLALNAAGVNTLPKRWLPNIQSPTIGTHVTMSGYQNGWLVTPKELCEPHGAVRAGCTKQPDGSYDIQLVALFAPQRWFGIAALVSWLTLAGCVAYVYLTRGREAPPTYRVTWRKLITRKGRRS